jgi:hypothetical protein
VLVGASAAIADPLDLVWDAPDTCAKGDDVRRDFDRSTRVLPGRNPPHLSAVARVEVQDGRWFLHLHTTRGGVEGDREIEADSCTSISRAAALVLALAYGEGSEPEAAPPSEPPQPPPPPPPPVVTVMKQPGEGEDASLAKRPGTPLTISVALDGRVAWGPLPGATAGAAATLDVGRGWWGASARVISWPGASGQPTSDVRTHFGGGGGALSMCLLGRPSRDLLISGCAGLQVAALRGTSSSSAPGFVSDVAPQRLAPWYAVPASVRARVRLFGTLHAEAGVELAASLTRPTFVVSGLSAPVYVVPELSPSGSLGLALDI